MKRMLAAIALAVIALAGAPSAHADQVAYLVNVTVRPGYDFPNPDAALAYGYGVCDRVGANVGYAQLVADVQRDFATADYYQGAYLINQAVNELCPAQIWRLRQSAAGYTLPA
jgi:opacity protein-like surface antigen